MNDPQKLLADYAQRGSEDAFTQLVQSHLSLVYSAALRLANGDSHLAEDITQTVFADLARSARTLSKDVMLGGWLHRHACFVSANTMRSDRRRKERERKAAEMNAPGDDTSGRLQEIAPELDDAINQLNEDDRHAIILRFFEQRDFSGVGRGLGASEEAARKRVSRALEKLHESLTRRGITLTATALGTALGAGLFVSAPDGLAAAIAASALGAAPVISTTAASANILSAGKMKLMLLAAAFAAVGTTPLYFAHQTQVALREENRSLRAQVEQLTAAQAESATQPARRTPMIAPAPAGDEHRELLRLRGQVGVLRDQLAKATAQGPSPSQPASQNTQTEPADISFYFPGIPVQMLLETYQNWSDKTLITAPEVAQESKTIWLKSPVNLTRAQAMQLTEDALKDQGHILIITNDSGSLEAVPAPKQ